MYAAHACRLTSVATRLRLESDGAAQNRPIRPVVARPTRCASTRSDQRAHPPPAGWQCRSEPRADRRRSGNEDRSRAGLTPVIPPTRRTAEQYLLVRLQTHNTTNNLYTLTL